MSKKIQVKNRSAVALGRLGAGIKKQMTPAAVRQRKAAVLSRWKKYREAKKAEARA